MAYNPAKHHRRSIRLKGYDYSSPGAYFITICTHQRDCLFGEIADGTMHLNQLGQIVSASWQRLPHHFLNVELDAFVVMPNHIHGILILCDRRGAALGQEICHTTGDAIPNATPNPTQLNPRGQEICHTTGDAIPNATPNPTQLNPRGQGFCPTTGDVLPNATESNAGVAFGTGDALPNATESNAGVAFGTGDALPNATKSNAGVAFGAKIGVNCDVCLPNAAPLRSGSLGAIPVGIVSRIALNFKSVTTRRINRIRRMAGVPVWQRNYYEHIIRDEMALQNIRDYIETNPLSWQRDKLHSDHLVP
ncbi:hypothetical protein AB3R30_07810 [Leptolyngbyaceae cyanobacterium UHCC 1019]